MIFVWAFEPDDDLLDFGKKHRLKATVERSKYNPYCLEDRGGAVDWVISVRGAGPKKADFLYMTCAVEPTLAECLTSWRHLIRLSDAAGEDPRVYAKQNKMGTDANGLWWARFRLRCGQTLRHKLSDAMGEKAAAAYLGSISPKISAGKEGVDGPVTPPGSTSTKRTTLIDDLMEGL